MTRDVGGSRVLHGFSAYGDNDSNDCNGHGTHVAGTVGGSTYGVAKNVTMYSVRVIGCNAEGSVADMIAGLDWIAKHWQTPSVASMSIVATRPSQPLDEALRRLISMGVPAVVAAGNYDSDACTFSPARVQDALTVAAAARDDTRWPLSNKGPCVDLYAPGVDVPSAYYATRDGKLTATGTSMAAPHVAGVVALYLQQQPRAQPEQVRAHILGSTVPTAVDNRNIADPTQRRATTTALLHVRQDTLPTLRFSPSTLQPVTLFADSTRVAQSQRIVVQNMGGVDVRYNVTVTPRSFLFADRVRISNSSGIVLAQGNTTITVQYNVVQLSFPGVYMADILVTTDGQPIVTAYLAQVNVFCSQLRAVPATAATAVNTIRLTTMQESRPTTWAPAPSRGPAVYFEAQVQLSHPTVDLPARALAINGGQGFLDTITPTGESGAYCGVFTVHGIIPLDSWERRTTPVCLTIEGSAVTDAYGNTFPDARQCSSYDHRPVGKIIAPYMAYSAEDGLVTQQSQVVLLVVFSEAIEGLEGGGILTAPAATVSGLKKLRGTDTYYQVMLSVPPTYFGQVQSPITDMGGRPALPITPLNFTRTAQPLIQTTAYKLLLPKSALATT